MNSDMFKSIKNAKARDLYMNMWEHNCIVNDACIKRTTIRKCGDDDSTRESHCSYSFKGEDKLETLINVFCIPRENKDLFRQKFAMACGCSGNGHEYMKMTTLHSSTLLALLFFYNVTEENKLTIDGIGTFYKSVFKFVSPVIDKGHNTCVDVVLIGENDIGEEILLFLESKFSEYYMCAAKRSCKISERYLFRRCSEALYNEEFLETLGIVRCNAKDGFFTINSKEVFYIDGIKQMIAHYVGIRNDIDPSIGHIDQKETAQDEVIELIKDGAKVILAEMLFDPIVGDFEIEDGKTYKDAYAEKYSLLASGMNAELEKAKLQDKFCVCPNVLYYSMFLKDDIGYKLDNKVRAFYFGEC